MPDIFRSTEFIISDDKVRIPDFDWDEPEAAGRPDTVLRDYDESEIRAYVPERFDSVAEAEDEFVPVRDEITITESARPYDEDLPRVKPAEEPVAAAPEMPELPEAEAEPEQSIESMIKFSPEELAEIYKPEIDAIKSDAESKAYYDAIRQKKAEVDRCIKSVNDQLDSMLKMQNDYFDSYERELKYLAIEIAQKMIMSRIEEDDLALNRLVMQTVNASKNSAWLKVEISEHLVGLVDALKDELKSGDDYCRIEVTPAAVPDDTVRVTGETGTIDASISTQAANLHTAFENAEKEDR